MSNAKLCYVEDNIMYFTYDMDTVCGDDWDDVPYELNAERPKEEYITAMIGFKGNSMTKEPHERGNFSVYEINNGAIPWLYHEDGGGLYGGDTMEKCIDWLQTVKYKWGVLHE